MFILSRMLESSSNRIAIVTDHLSAFHAVCSPRNGVPPAGSLPLSPSCALGLAFIAIVIRRHANRAGSGLDIGYWQHLDSLIVIIAR